VLSLKRGGRTIIQREEDLLRAAQAMRDAGVIDMRESHYLVSRAIIGIAEYRTFAERTSPALEGMDTRESSRPMPMLASTGSMREIGDRGRSRRLPVGRMAGANSMCSPMSPRRRAAS
jgi:hypothetical protein